MAIHQSEAEVDQSLLIVQLSIASKGNQCSHQKSLALILTPTTHLKSTDKTQLQWILTLKSTTLWYASLTSIRTEGRATNSSRPWELLERAPLRSSFKVNKKIDLHTVQALSTPQVPKLLLNMPTNLLPSRWIVKHLKQSTRPISCNIRDKTVQCKTLNSTSP